MGHQFPFNGDAHIGIGAFFGNSDIFSEYAQIQLTTTLQPLHLYNVSMRINLANYSGFSVANFGAYLSATRPIKSPYYDCDAFKFRPQLISGFIKDTLNWIQIDTTFTATGGEAWITIGRFDYEGYPIIDSVSPEIIEHPIYSFNSYGYYFIDCVAVINVTPTNYIPVFPNIFTPNNDGDNNIFPLPYFDHLSNEQLRIYNRWGQELA